MDRPSLIRTGDHRAIAALMRDLDDGREGAEEELGALVAGTAAPFVVGVTGPAGAGKSTIVDALVARLRAGGARVGVVAVDPSSPLGGGAVLGDRIRMQRHATDPGVFIRSLATRGATGGLARAAAPVIATLGAGGFSSVLVETVGVGQAEIDVAAAADVVVVVLVPGLGDDIQAMKAGLLEIADVLVVNKADRPGAEQTLADLAGMLDIRRAAGGMAGQSSDVPIVRVVATTGEGIDDLLAAIAGARAQVASAPRRRRRAEQRIEQIAVSRLSVRVRAALVPGGEAAALVEEVAAGRMDAARAAEVLMSRLGRGY